MRKVLLLLLLLLFLILRSSRLEELMDLALLSEGAFLLVACGCCAGVDVFADAGVRAVVAAAADVEEGLWWGRRLMVMAGGFWMVAGTEIFLLALALWSVGMMLLEEAFLLLLVLVMMLLLLLWRLLLLLLRLVMLMLRCVVVWMGGLVWVEICVRRWS